ncbi:MAG: DMT family transporter, partial [Alphaproteobacteria bacterium]|nr:DMT family transporter [Alphaproteobacteria bacterium]
LASALLARAILGERIRNATWLAMLGVGGGIAVMLADSWQAGGLAGDLLAIGVAASLAGYTVSLRAGRRIDLVPAVFAAGVLTALATLPLGAPFAIAWADLARLVFMGVVQLGLGLVLFVYGVRYLAAAEASLLTLLEAVLAPLWVWLAVGEGLSALGLVGAAAVVGGLALHSLYALQRERKPAIAPPHPL